MDELSVSAWRRHLVRLASVAAAFLFAQPAHGEAFVLEQGVNNYEGMDDNTIYADLQENSAGGFALFYSGMTVSSVRRALLRFSVETIPTDIAVSSASLMIHLDYSGLDADDSDVYTLHRLTGAWGESEVQPPIGSQGGLGAPALEGDATWTYQFFDTSPWQTPGGDFAAEPSASLTISRWDPVTPENNFYTFTSEQMALDLNDWIQHPEQNFGWILIGNESRSRSARRFDSSEGAEGLRPRLTIAGEQTNEAWILF